MSSLGIGFRLRCGLFGKGRRASAGVKINHYSNGNIIMENALIEVPINVGYTL
jgi:hypothetical protein